MDEYIRELLKEKMVVCLIAQEQGISRQGVHDLIKRCNGILEDYESKLQLVKKFNEIKKKVSSINELTEDTDIGHEQLKSDVKRLSDEIMEIL